MNTYPTLPTRMGPDKVIFDILTDVAANGTVRTRLMHDRRRREFALVHPNLTATQKTALESFFDAQIGAFTYQRQRETLETYTVQFIGAPQPTYEKGARYTMSVTLREV
jgi:hypothetical protein